MTQATTISYRGYCPDSGPAKTAADLAHWATGAMLATPGAIYANSRDIPALSGTMLAARVAGSPRFGVVQPGTLWLLAAEVA
jgi:hypothetical protein